MSYSMQQKDFSKNKQSSSFTYFTEKEWSNYPFASESDLQWFRDAKYGLFLHVGIAAIGMVDISWSRKTHKLPDPNFAKQSIPDTEYDGWAKKLEFPKLKAEDWAKLAIKSGFKYVVIIAKHHDGFHMWDTAYSEYKITNSPFGRDYLKELVNAFRNVGLKIGIYYSKRDWVHPDYEPVPLKDAIATKTPPHFKMINNMQHYITEKHKKYQEYLFNTVRELMTN